MLALIRSLGGHRFSALRLLSGVLIAAACFQWSYGQDLQQWLFPFVFATGMLTTWATGPRWGWLVTTGYLLVQGSLAIANTIRGPLDWFYHGNLLAAVLAQSETIWITVLFAMVAGTGGLCGWVVTALVSHVMPSGTSRLGPPD
jgi:hypothetical protein